MYIFNLFFRQDIECRMICLWTAIRLLFSFLTIIFMHDSSLICIQVIFIHLTYLMFYRYKHQPAVCTGRIYATGQETMYLRELKITANIVAEIEGEAIEGEDVELLIEKVKRQAEEKVKSGLAKKIKTFIILSLSLSASSYRLLSAIHLFCAK